MPVSDRSAGSLVRSTGVPGPHLDWLAGQDKIAPTSVDMAKRAASLGNRLLDVEEQTILIRAQMTRLRREAENGGTGTMGGGWFDVPKARHSWPLVEHAGQDPNKLPLYDRRVDDPVVIEGRRGEAFLAAYWLTGPSPAFADCVTALNDQPPVLRLIPAQAAEQPDISIIIPIYGQLGYTLNCLDSLITHASRYSAEIIVIDDRSPDESSHILPGIPVIRHHLQPQNGGFIKSCNTGALLARGRYLLMLNNDTRVVAGWLDALLDSFVTFPAAGLVGSKLCYADGSLQEAGGIIWRDGSCWNYGRNDDPNRPQYSHARRVDYVSGCSIAVPVDLWQILGGFDPLYTPAYCEDADLALRISAAGREIWLQPQSRVIHYEGKTGGTDTSTGVKAYQIVNSRKMYLRWRERLERHRPNAEAPYFERERHEQRRMLVVDVSMPTPKQDAGSVQTALGLRVCQRLGYKTYFVAEDNWLFHSEYTTDLQKIGIECGYAPYDLGFTDYIRRYGPMLDVVMVYRVSILERVIDDIRRHAPQAVILFHVADLHFLRRQREALLEGSEDGLLEAEAIKKRELALVAAADCTITHSPVEANILAQELPNAPVAVWPMMFDFFGTSVPFASRNNICFLGGYRHPPNVDAMVYLSPRSSRCSVRRNLAYNCSLPGRTQRPGCWRLPEMGCRSSEWWKI